MKSKDKPTIVVNIKVAPTDVAQQRAWSQFWKRMIQGARDGKPD